MVTFIFHFILITLLSFYLLVLACYLFWWSCLRGEDAGIFTPARLYVVDHIVI